MSRADDPTGTHTGVSFRDAINGAVVAFGTGDVNASITFSSGLNGQDVVLATPISGTSYLNYTIGLNLTINGSNLGANHGLARSATAGNFRFFQVGGTGKLTLSNIALRNGNSGTSGDGGALVVSGGSVTLNSTIFDSNTARDGGGVEFSSGTMTFNSPTFKSNHATRSGGGLHYLSGNSTGGGFVFTNNRADSRGGGLFFNAGGTSNIGFTSASTGNSAGIYGGLVAYEGATTANVSSSTINGNSAQNGGGISIGPGVTLNLSSSTVSGNSANFQLIGGSPDSGSGGGVYVAMGSTAVVTNSTIRSNFAGTRGGGLYIQGGSTNTVSISDSTFGGTSSGDGNTADLGGAIYSQATYTTSVLRSAVLNNSATTNGGGILVVGGTTNIYNSTISANRVSSLSGAGGVSASGSGTTVRLVNDTVAFNQNAGVQQASSAVVRSSNTIFSGNSGADFVGVFTSSGNNLVANTASTLGGSDITTAANLGALALNGGTTANHALLAGSNAINAGSNGEAASVSLSTDQRGSARANGTVDIGAYELLDPNPPIAAFNSVVNIGSANATTNTTTVVITYSDPDGSGLEGPSGVNTTTFGLGNITVNNGATVTAFVASGNTVTYTIKASGATWAASPQGTYTVALVGGTVKDRFGNGIAANSSLGTFTVDGVPPTGAIAGTPANINVATGGNTTTTFSITYADANSGVATSSFGIDDVTVANGSAVATITGFTVSTNTVTYTAQAPGGTWAASTQGTYTISIAAGKVTDNAGNGILAVASAGTFAVNTIAPFATLFTQAPNIRVVNATPGTNSFTIWYTSLGAAINAASFGIGNVTVTSGANTLSVISISATADNKVTYIVQAPGGIWANAPGTYTIALNGNSVKDVSGNAVAANPTLGFFDVDAAAPTAALTSAPANINASNILTGDNEFTITYSDVGDGVDPATFGIGNVSVFLGGTTLTVSTAMVSGNSVTYTVLAPNNNWSTAPQGTYTIAIVGNNIKDKAGNGIVANPNFAFFGVDSKPPTATLTTAPANINSTTGGNTTATFEVTYADTDTGVNASSFGVNDVTVTNGAAVATVTGFSVVGNTVTYTIQAPGGTWNVSAQGTYTISVVAGKVTDVAGNGIAAVASLGTFTVNTIRPFATLTTVAPNITATNTLPATNTFTITYSTLGAAINPATFDVSNVAVTNGATTLTVISASATPDFKVTYTVQAPNGSWIGATQGIYTIALVGNSVKDVAGNAVLANATLGTFTVDTAGPTAALTTAAPNINASNILSGDNKFTITYSDAGFGVDTNTFGIGNVSVSLGGTVLTVATAQVSVNAVTYTVLAPNNDWSTAPQGTYTIAIVANSVKDKAGNGIVANPNFAFFRVDSKPPTAILTTPPVDINSTTGGSTTATFAITYADTDTGVDIISFGTDDVKVTNGAAVATVTGASSVGNKVTYTIQAPGGTWDASLQGTYTISIVAGRVTDNAGNGIAAVASLGTFAVHTIRPFATMVNPVTNIAVANATPNTNSFTVAYSTLGVAINPATFSVANVSVTVGATPLTVISASATADFKVTYTVQAPTGTWAAAPQGVYTIAMNGDSVKDIAGNAVLANATLGFFTVDTTAPTATLSVPVSNVNVANLSPGTNSFKVTYFDAASGIDPASFGVGNVTVFFGATILAVSTAMVDGNVVTYTVLAPNGDWTTAPMGTYTITLVGNSVKDKLGNGIAGNANFGFFKVDYKPPTAALTDPIANINQASAPPGTNTFSITYSDVGVGLDSATFGLNDVTVSNGAVNLNVTAFSINGNIVTYTVGPLGGSWVGFEGTYTVSLNADSVNDLAGNPVAPIASLGTFIVDITAPTVIITPNGGFTNASPIVFTFQFSEPVFGFSADSISLVNGTKGTFTAVSSLAYTLAVTPNADGIVRAQITTAALDQVGNSGALDAFAEIFSDRTGPIITISQPSVTAIINGSVKYTVTYDDPRFNLSTLVAGNIVLNRTGTANGTVSVTGTGNVRIVTISNVYGNGTLGISIVAGTASDTVGNFSTAAGPSTTFTVSGSRLLRISQPAAPAIIFPGTIKTYMIDYSNVGNQVSPNASIIVTLPAQATFTARGSTAGWTAIGGGKYRLNLGYLQPGARGRVAFTVTYSAKAPPSTVGRFTAFMTDTLANGAAVATSTVSSKIVDPRRAHWNR